MRAYLSQLSHSIHPLKRGQLIACLHRAGAWSGLALWRLESTRSHISIEEVKTYTSLTSDFAKDKLATEGVGANALA